MAAASLNVLLILSYYHKCISVDDIKDKGDKTCSESLPREETLFSENPFRKAVENAQDVECMIFCIAISIIIFIEDSDIYPL